MLLKGINCCRGLEAGRGGVVLEQQRGINCCRDSPNPDDASAVINRTVIVAIIG